MILGIMILGIMTAGMDSAITIGDIQPGTQAGGIMTLGITEDGTTLGTTTDGMTLGTTDTATGATLGTIISVLTTATYIILQSHILAVYTSLHQETAEENTTVRGSRPRQVRAAETGIQFQAAVLPAAA